MIRAVDLAELGTPQALDTRAGAADTRRQRAAGGTVTATRRRARVRRLKPFPLMLANAVMHEPRRRGATATQHDQALADHHHAALVRALKRLKIPHERGTSPLVTMPFLLAGPAMRRRTS